MFNNQYIYIILLLYYLHYIYIINPLPTQPQPYLYILIYMSIHICISLYRCTPTTCRFILPPLLPLSHFIVLLSLCHIHMSYIFIYLSIHICISLLILTHHMSFYLTNSTPVVLFHHLILGVLLYNIPPLHRNNIHQTPTLLVIPSAMNTILYSPYSLPYVHINNL